MQQDQTTQPADAAAVPADAATAAASMPEATSPAAVDAAADAVVAGDTSNAAALQQMGFDHLIQNFDWVGWTVFVTLVIMSIVSWIYTVMNAMRNTSITGKMEKVIRTFWKPRRRPMRCVSWKSSRRANRSRRSRSTAPRPLPITSATKVRVWSKP